MIAIALLLMRMLCDCFKSRSRLEAALVVLRHQLNVLRLRAPRRLYLRWADRILFVWLYRRLPRTLDAITIVSPETVVRWHRMGFAAYWRWKSRPPGGRPWVDRQIRDLIRRMSFENPLWGAPKIHGELLTLLRLPWLAPDIITAVVNGRQPPQLNAKKLMRVTAHLP